MMKAIKYTTLFLLLFTLCGCPTMDDFNTYGLETEVADLIKVTPIKEAYTQGEEITVTVTIPSINTFYGETRNIYDATQDNKGLIQFASLELFRDNQVTMVEGTAHPEYINNYYFKYYPDNQEYRLKIKVKLNRKGDYKIRSFQDILTFGDKNGFRITTNIEGVNPDTHLLTFTVQ